MDDWDRLRTFQDPKEVRFVSEKERTKEFLRRHGVVVPRTLAFISPQTGGSELLDRLPGRFVVKPDRGSLGGGVWVLARQGDGFVEPDGQEHTAEQVLQHIRREPLAGRATLIEERVEPHPELAAFSAYGAMLDFGLYFTGIKL